jgi:DNA repair exonuclease SbcCD ATPase subunit
VSLHLQEIESLQNSLREREKYVTELENRLRALWDKLEGERKHYMNRIKRLEEVGDKMEIYCDTILARDWKEAKEAKP